MNHFQCWNSDCKSELTRSWKEVEDDNQVAWPIVPKDVFKRTAKEKAIILTVLTP